MLRSSKDGIIEQEVIITGATPHQVFEVLMDEEKHAKLTNGEVKISRKVGGAFTTFDGWANGKQLELEADKKIVQTWRAEDWPDGAESTCTHVLTVVPGGTKIQFTQTGVPKAFVTTVAKGWAKYYWEPLKKLFIKPS